MKKIFLAILIVFMMAGVLSAKEISVTFTWDPNTEIDMAGYAIFQRQEGQAYDYTQPIDPPCTIIDGGCYTNAVNKTNQLTVPLTVPDGQLTIWHWVARAKDTENNWSADSNEVSLEVNLTALSPINDFSAIFNKVAQTVDFTWTQSDLTRVKSWQLFQSTVTGGPYTSIATIPWDGTSSVISASIPADTLSPGQDYYFVVVSFADFGIFSSNSNEIKIDRRSPTKVINLKITLQ